MQRSSQTLWSSLLVIGFVGFGCRGGEHAGAHDAAVHHAYTPPTHAMQSTNASEGAPNAALGVGGGPTSEAVYGASSALAVLLSAGCRCDDSEACRQATAARYGELLTRCVRGVDQRVLSDCASHEVSQSCGPGNASPPASCTTAALCESFP